MFWKRITLISLNFFNYIREIRIISFNLLLKNNHCTHCNLWSFYSSSF